jgi:outer membrane receptor protein involved in Fe transport
LRGANLKVSWQLSKSNKIIGVYMLGQKLQPQESAGRFRPLEATRDYVNQSRVKKIEFQSTLGNRLLINAIGGYGGFVGDYNAMRSQWYTGAPSVLHRDTGLRTGSDEMSDQRPRYNYQYDGSISYFPERSFAGRHELKTGATMYYYVHGSGFLDQDHGNYVLTYDGITPAEIQINNYPVTPHNRLNTYAWYVKDTWRLTDRLTANLGMRYERQTPFIPAQRREASREFPTLFPAGDFPKTEVLTWNRVLPRVGLSWSLNNRTVVKMTTGVYNYLWNEEDAGLYNLNAAASATFRWSDPDRNGDYTPARSISI